MKRYTISFDYQIGEDIIEDDNGEFVKYEDIKQYLPIKSILKQGTQIIYVPAHVPITDVNHPDSEQGFIWKMARGGEAALCRYWSKHSTNELRTKANGEWTPTWRLIIKNTRPQRLIDETINSIIQHYI